jgi:hypothetical protein
MVRPFQPTDLAKLLCVTARGRRASRSQSAADGCFDSIPQ